MRARVPDRTRRHVCGQAQCSGGSGAGGRAGGTPSLLGCCSGGESCHLQGNALPQLLGLLASLEVLQHVVKLHHSHRRQAEGAPGAADDVDEVVVVGGRQVDEPVVDVLQRHRGRCDSTHE